MALTTLRTTYHLMGRHDDALDMWRASNARDPEALAAFESGYAEGGYEGALRTFARMLEVRSDTTYVTPWQIGTAYTRAGEGDLALDYLERAFEERDPNIPYLSVDPIFDYLRDEPRFRAMIERLGLPE
jgi:tetratricopeptide (TPR) repeat protein